MTLRLAGVHKSFGRVSALDGLDLTVSEGEFHVLLGPSSAGKTTTLRLISGLEKPDRGEVSLYGRDALDKPVQGRGLAMIFQSFALYPHLRVRENLAYPLRYLKLSARETAERIERIADLLRIGHRLDNRTTELSGGEQQRVAIGRALIREPRILLLDEPLTNLDAKLRDAMRVEFKRLHRRLGVTMLYATPDQLEATTMGERISVIDRGRVIASGKPEELYDDPPSLRVAGLIGSPPVNLVPVRAQGEMGLDLGFARLAGGPPARSSGEAVCILRPHDLIADAADPDFHGRVVMTELLGDVAVATIEAALPPHEKTAEAGTLRLRSVVDRATAARIKSGDMLPLRIRRERLRLLPREAAAAQDN